MLTIERILEYCGVRKLESVLMSLWIYQILSSSVGQFRVGVVAKTNAASKQHVISSVEYISLYYGWATLGSY